MNIGCHEHAFRRLPLRNSRIAHPLPAPYGRQDEKKLNDVACDVEDGTGDQGNDSKNQETATTSATENQSRSLNHCMGPPPK